jgi:hypothetical protein
MSDQAADNVRRYVGDPALPDQDGKGGPEIDEKAGQDQNVVEDVAAAAVGAPPEEIESTGTGEEQS